MEPGPDYRCFFSSQKCKYPEPSCIIPNQNIPFLKFESIPLKRVVIVRVYTVLALQVENNAAAGLWAFLVIKF